MSCGCGITTWTNSLVILLWFIGLVLVGRCWTREHVPRRVGAKRSFVGQFLGVSVEEALAKRPLVAHQVNHGTTTTSLLSICAHLISMCHNLYLLCWRIKYNFTLKLHEKKNRKQVFFVLLISQSGPFQINRAISFLAWATIHSISPSVISWSAWYNLNNNTHYHASASSRQTYIHNLATHSHFAVDNTVICRHHYICDGTAVRSLRPSK